MRKKRKYRIIYCTDKDITKGDMYAVYASDRKEYEAILEEIKRLKYKILDKPLI